MNNSSLCPKVCNDSQLLQIDDFYFEKLLSRGSFSDVHIGYRKDNPDKKYAIKTIKKGNYLRKNLFSQICAEKDALAMSKSPLVVSIYYSLQNDDCVFLVMEYVEGSSDFQVLIDSNGSFDLKSSIRYSAQVLMALEYIHKHGIVHRDLKLSNILLTRRDCIKLIDFGLSFVDINRNIDERDILMTPTGKTQNLVVRTPRQIKSLIQPIKQSIIRNFNNENSNHVSKNSKKTSELKRDPILLESNVTKNRHSKFQDTSDKVLGDQITADCHEESDRRSIKSRILGTAYYLAPEVIRKDEDQDGRVDIWALGVCFYQMLTTLAPFMEEELEDIFNTILHKHLIWYTGDIDLFGFAGIKFVEDCLNKDSSKRPGAAELKRHEIFKTTDFQALWLEIDACK